MLSPIVRDVQRQRCCKRGSGDGQRLSLDYGTTERSFNAVERRGSTLTWTVCTAAESEERQICTTCLFAESVGLCLLQISSNFALARSLSANQGREIAQNRNIDPRDSVVKDLTATGAMRARLSQFGLAWGRHACRYLPTLGRVRRFSPGTVRALSDRSRVNCLPNHFLATKSTQQAVGFLHDCRWFNKKCPRHGEVLFDPSLPNTFADTACPRARPSSDVSAMIRHGASTTCLRLNLSPHYLADQCFYFERSRGSGSRRGFAQGQS